MGKNKQKLNQEYYNYELSSSVEKIKSSESQKSKIKTSIDNQFNNNKNEDIESCQLNQQNNMATASLFENNVFAHYDKLRDNIECWKKDVNTEISNQKDFIIKLVDDKIKPIQDNQNKYVPYIYFAGTCGIFVLFGILIYTLSYSPLIINTNKNTENSRNIVDSIKSINIRLDIFKNELEKQSEKK